ncbi:MAG: hypothetical protein NTX50_00525 [Candidatus Sumerlaeota bacterium]|nr:hypothetical protein [Candidatus Sumerlaeota bacterium]
MLADKRGGAAIVDHRGQRLPEFPGQVGDETRLAWLILLVYPQETVAQNENLRVGIVPVRLPGVLPQDLVAGDGFGRVAPLDLRDLQHAHNVTCPGYRRSLAFIRHCSCLDPTGF